MDLCLFPMTDQGGPTITIKCVVRWYLRLLFLQWMHVADYYINIRERILLRMASNDRHLLVKCFRSSCKGST